MSELWNDVNRVLGSIINTCGFSYSLYTGPVVVNKKNGILGTGILNLMRIKSTLRTIHLHDIEVIHMTHFSGIWNVWEVICWIHALDDNVFLCILQV